MREVEDSLRRLRHRSASTSIRSIGPIRWCASRRPRAPCALLRARQDPRHRRQQFLGGADGAVPRALARCTCCSRPTTCSSAASRPTSCRIAAITRSRPWAMARCAAACLSGRMRADTEFAGDDLRLLDPKFQPAASRNILLPSSGSISFAQRALRQARHSPGGPLGARSGHHHGAVGRAPSRSARSRSRRRCGWSLDAAAKAEIDRILAETITDPVGPEFMAPAEYA